MSDSQEPLWSDNPNAPKISRTLYLDEKADFAGNLLASILYGMLNAPPPPPPPIRAQSVRFILGTVIVVFFRCIAALFNPVYRKGERIKWWLVCYTVVMFSFATAFAGVNLDILSISFIDNREFPGVEDKLPPGPYGYQLLIYPGALNVSASVMFILSNWLADAPLVGSPFDVTFTHASNPGCSPASPLLRNLLQEPLGDRLPLPHVPQFFGYVFEFSANRWRQPGLTSAYSHGRDADPPVLASGQR